MASGEDNFDTARVCAELQAALASVTEEERARFTASFDEEQQKGLVRVGYVLSVVDGRLQFNLPRGGRADPVDLRVAVTERAGLGHAIHLTVAATDGRSFIAVLGVDTVDRLIIKLRRARELLVAMTFSGQDDVPLTGVLVAETEADAK